MSKDNGLSIKKGEDSSTRKIKRELGKIIGAKKKRVRAKKSTPYAEETKNVGTRIPLRIINEVGQYNLSQQFKELAEKLYKKATEENGS